LAPELAVVAYHGFVDVIRDQRHGSPDLWYFSAAV